MLPALVLPDDVIFAACAIVAGLLAGFGYAWYHG